MVLFKNKKKRKAEEAQELCWLGKRTAKYLIGPIRDVAHKHGLSADLIDMGPDSSLILFYLPGDKEQAATIIIQGFVFFIPINANRNTNRIDIWVSCRLFSDHEVDRVLKITDLILGRIAF